MSKIGAFDINSIIHGDCLKVIPGIPGGSIDLILSDWPYGTTSAAWDSVIPLEPLWKQVKRVIKPNGAIVLTAKQPFTTVLAMSNLSWFRYELIWKKSNGGEFLNANRKPLPRHENILVFYGKLPTYNPQMTKGDAYACTRAGVGVTTADLSVIGWTTVNEGERYPISILDFPNDTGLHPTQKPVALFSYLIKTYSNPGDLVLDNTAGSCTTAIAAIDTDRNYLCIEKYPLPDKPIGKDNPDYVGIGRERVRQRLLQPFIPGLIEEQPQPVQLALETQITPEGAEVREG